MKESKRIGGRLCLDFTNTVSSWEPEAGGFRAVEERLSSYRSWLDWLRVGGGMDDAGAIRLAQRALDEPAAAKASLARVHQLRAALYRLFRAFVGGHSPAAEDLDRLNAAWRAARAEDRLAATESGLALVPGPAGADLDAPLGSVVRSAVELLSSPELARVRWCPGEDCGWLFLDTSKSGRRRWCDMGDCGNVAKVRRFRARQPG